jgi:hypothetical protein
MTATGFLREAFQADRVGIWHVDLVEAGIWPVKRPCPDGSEPIAAGCEGLPAALQPAPAAYPRPGIIPRYCSDAWCRGLFQGDAA